MNNTDLSAQDSNKAFNQIDMNGVYAGVPLALILLAALILAALLYSRKNKKKSETKSKDQNPTDDVAIVTSLEDNPLRIERIVRNINTDRRAVSASKVESNTNSLTAEELATYNSLAVYKNTMNPLVGSASEFKTNRNSLNASRYSNNPPQKHSIAFNPMKHDKITERVTPYDILNKDDFNIKNRMDFVLPSEASSYHGKVSFGPVRINKKQPSEVFYNNSLFNKNRNNSV
jgi:hypothetical protein